VTLAGVASASSLTVQATGTTDVSGNIATTGPVILRSGQLVRADNSVINGSGNLIVADIDAGTGAITLAANNGRLEAGILAGGAIDARATGSANDQGDVRIAGVASASSLDVNAARNLDVDGPVTIAGPATLTAGNDLTTVDIDTGSSAITATATAGTLVMGTLAGGAIDVRATAGNATVAAIRRGDAAGATTVAVTAGQVATITGATIATGSAGVTGGSGASTGAITTAAPITITATTGNAETGVLSGGAVLVKAVAGNATVAGISQSSSATIEARGSITTTGATSSSGEVKMTAGTDSTAGTITAAGISAGSAGLTLVARGGQITLNGTANSAGTAGLEARRIDLANNAEVIASARTTITISGPGTTASIGGAAGDDRLLDGVDLAGFRSSELQLVGGARDLEIQGVDLFPNVRQVGIGMAATGNIRVVGALRFATGTGAQQRTLTLGGDATAVDLDESAVQARSIAVVAQPALSNSTPAANDGQILAAGSVVRLRATYIALGLAPSPTPGLPFLDTLLGATPPTTDVVRSQFLINPTSSLYTPVPQYQATRPTLVAASRLVLSAGQWALIQNTDRAAQPGGGILLDTLQLNRLGTGPDPVVAVFGSLGGQEGIAAALRITPDQLDGISPNNVRINGCVALSTAGCIVTGLPLPLVQLNDPSRGLLISTPPDLILPVELISGTTNEALWRDDEDLAPGTVPAAERTPAELQP
jgi:hypothetical protein